LASYNYKNTHSFFPPAHSPAVAAVTVIVVPVLQLVLLGPRIALALPDCRAQRTDTQVLSLDTHMNFILKTNVSSYLVPLC
jgi:hypothetical protein